MIGILMSIFSGCLIGSGIWIIFNINEEPRQKRKFKQRIKSQMGKILKKKALRNDEADNIVKGTHYYISVNHYNNMRFIIAAIFILFGAISINSNLFIFSIAFFILSWPKENVGKLRLPFYYFCMVIRNIDKEKKDIELMEVLSLLKNIMVQMRNNPLGADYIIDYIALNTELTKTAFLKLLNQMRLNRYREAEEFFEDEIGTPLSKDVARIMLQLDSLNPMELEEMLVSVQRQIREMKITSQKSRTELVSDLVMIPISFTMMIIFLNFILVTMGIDQFNQLTMLF